MRKSLLVLVPLLVGCAGTTSYVRSDTTLGRVVIYRNGVAYFERTAKVNDDTLRLSVPADKIDDFLKSLTVTDAKSGEPAPVDFPSNGHESESGFTEMKIHLQGNRPHELKLTYVTETPAWKPSYRVVLGSDGKVTMQAWAIVDNTSGEDWNNVKLGVGSSSALSFRFDLRSVRTVQRETLQANDLFALAPPTGGAAYGQPGRQRVLGELSDLAIAANDVKSAAANAVPEVVLSGPLAGASAVRKSGKKDIGSVGHGAARKAESAATDLAAIADGGASGGAGGPPSAARKRAVVAVSTSPSDIVRVAQDLRASNRSVVIEGFADKADGDKSTASLDRANRVREQLIQNGVAPSQLVAVGQGEQAGRAGGVRIVEATPAAAPPEFEVTKHGKGGPPSASMTPVAAAPVPAQPPPPETLEPIGTSHFESKTGMTVLRGNSAMVSILDSKTDGEVVYFYDAESPRGNAGFAFKAVRLINPTDSVLESGPVTVFGDGRFIGEGLAEPIPARSTAFVPFALDRQVVVERKDADRDAIARIISVQRGVFSSEVKHTRRFVYGLHNRMPAPATVYVRHTVANGYKLAVIGKDPPQRIGAAHLFRVQVPAGATTELVVEESTPVFKTIDLRSPVDMDQIRVYLSADAVENPLRAPIQELIKMQQELGNMEQRILTTREQMQAYRARMDELHGQIVSLRLVKTGGGLMKNLEKKMQDVSDKMSQSTIDLAALEEKAMLLRIHFQDGVADLSLEKKPS